MIRILTVNQTWLHRNFHSVFVSPKNWDTPWYTQNCHLKFWNKPSSTMFNQFFWGVPYGVPCFWTIFLRLRVAPKRRSGASNRMVPFGWTWKKNWQFLSIKSCNIRLPSHTWHVWHVVAWDEVAQPTANGQVTRENSICWSFALYTSHYLTVESFFSKSWGWNVAIQQSSKGSLFGAGCWCYWLQSTLANIKIARKWIFIPT